MSETPERETYVLTTQEDGELKETSDFTTNYMEEDTSPPTQM
jgi:hypothetical protein